ncbi:MAG: M56 family metallopeptidase, partial [Acidobacteriota bacterium]
MELLSFGNLLAHASQAALLTAGAALLARAVRGLHPQLTVFLWQGVLVAIAVLPFAQPRTSLSSQLVVYQQVGVTAQPAVAGAPDLAIFGLVLPALAAVLVLGVVARLSWILVGLRRLRRFAASTAPVRELPDAVRAALRDSGARAEFREADLAGPVSFGLRRGVVVLPREFSQIDASRQYLVALHELIHVRRRDALQSLVEEVLVAVFWFYPWTWWIRRRLRLAREQAVDRATAPDRAVRSVYITTLLGFAGLPPRPLPTASGMWQGHELRARVDALYREVTMSRSRLLLSTAATVFALGAVAVLAASAFPMLPVASPASPAAQVSNRETIVPLAAVQQQDDEIVKVGGDVKPPRKIKDVKPVYPEDAREAGIEGVVIVEAVLDKEGTVASAA